MSGRRRLRDAVLWLGVLAATTAVLIPFRPQLDKAHISLVLLLVVLGAGAQGGRVLGVGIGVASFLAFDWYFLEPLHTLVITNPLDWFVLLAFLVTSVVAAQLLHREQQAARTATARADEIDRLASLGAEALAAARAEDALGAVAAMIRDSTQAEACAVYLTADRRVQLGAASPSAAGNGPPSPLVEWVARERAPAVATAEGTSRLWRAGSTAREVVREGDAEVRALFLPLTVHDQTVGVLRLDGPAVARLDDSQWRFLDALSYYAALGAERVRLAADIASVEALREADRLKDALIASVSHDLRTPLTTIKGLAHQLGALGDERSLVIEEQADRLNRLVADLLDLSRLNAGAMPLHLELNAVDDLVGAALQDTEQRLAGHTILTRFARDEAVLVGRFDLALSIRVLVNLIENAIKYSSAASTITLAARREGSRIHVSVTDQGRGVPPGEEERIFTPFYRPAAERPDAGSAGLGLAIARRMAEWQGGAVTYTRLAHGSTFTLSLPAADTRAP